MAARDHERMAGADWEPVTDDHHQVTGENEALRRKRAERAGGYVAHWLYGGERLDSMPYGKYYILTPLCQPMHRLATQTLSG